MDQAAAAVHAADPAHLDTATGLDNRKMAFWTFIGSECILFGSLIASYMAYKGESIVGPCPRAGTLPNGQACEGILNIPLTTFSTFILLMSSVAMVLGLAAVQRGAQKRAAIWLGATAFLGSIFLGCQVFEFTHFWHEGLQLSTNLFGSTFFVLTGFHGAHVFVGIIYMVTLATLAAFGRLTPEKSLNVEVGGLYWHFVDVVWIIIFPLVYLIP
jgi:cytochrome c oxidase subunit 3/cytochrome o ubiquinol oxidase subunit 3